MPDDANPTTRFDDRLGGEVTELRGPHGTARIATLGAHVLAWEPAGEAPALWLSPVSRLDGARGVRGGVPVCWPWFAQHPLDPVLSSHGFVRTEPWRRADSGPGRIRFETEADARPGFPHRARVALEVSLGARLAIALTTENTGTTTIPLSEALHTYFAVGDIGAIEIAGFDGLTYLDKLDDNRRKVQSGTIRFAGELDRIYLGHTGGAEIRDRLLGRRITIAKQGSASSVVWNPWIEKSARLGDIDPPGTCGGHRRFVCVETANAGDDVVSLAPGARHTLAAELAVARL